MPAGKMYKYIPAVRKKRKPKFTQKVKRVLNRNREKHHFENIQYEIDVVDTGAQLYDITQVAQGHTDIDRKGDRIDIQKIRLSYYIVGQGNHGPMRMILFQYRDDSTTSPSIAELLENTTVPQQAIVSAINWDDRHRYKIVWDKVWYFGNNGMSNGSTSGTITFSGKKLGNPTLQYDNATTTGWNHYYILVVSTKSTSGGPLATFGTHVEFYDS